MIHYKTLVRWSTDGMRRHIDAESDPFCDIWLNPIIFPCIYIGDLYTRKGGLNNKSGPRGPFRYKDVVLAVFDSHDKHKRFFFEMDRIHLWYFLNQSGHSRSARASPTPFQNKRIDSPRIKVAYFSSFYVKMQTVGNKIKKLTVLENMLACLSFSLERIHCLRFDILFLLSRSLPKLKVSERWLRVGDARWTYGLVSVCNFQFWKVYVICKYGILTL